MKREQLWQAIEETLEATYVPQPGEPSISYPWEEGDVVHVSEVTYD